MTETRSLYVPCAFVLDDEAMARLNIHVLGMADALSVPVAGLLKRPGNVVDRAIARRDDRLVAEGVYSMTAELDGALDKADVSIRSVDRFKGTISYLNGDFEADCMVSVDVPVLYYVPCRKAISPFRTEYSSYSSIVREFERDLKAVLPVRFDVGAHVAALIGLCGA